MSRWATPSSRWRRISASWSEHSGALTCSYLTPTHRTTAARIRDFMLAAGLATHVDAVGNVVGVMAGAPNLKRVLTGSHYDTVINAGKYDGRLGIVLPIAVAGALRRAGVKLPYTLEIIAFSEEEGVRFKSTFLGSRAVAGRFDSSLLDSVDANGTTLSEAIHATGAEVAAIPAIARDSAQMRVLRRGAYRTGSGAARGGAAGRRSHHHRRLSPHPGDRPRSFWPCRYSANGAAARRRRCGC